MTEQKELVTEPCHEQRLHIAKFFVWAFEELTRGEEKEGVGIVGGADGRAAFPGHRDNGELSPSSEDS